MKASELQKEYKSYLVFRNYRPHTIKAYTKIIQHFFVYCQTAKKINQSLQSIHDYAKSYLTKRLSDGRSWSSVNMDYSALMILCRHVLHVDWSYELIPRPRTLKKLPQVLSPHEIEKMINGIKNLKHKTIVLLLYTSGIRSSELVNLDIADVCMDRHQLHIRLGKGGKDRLVQIPAITLEFIRGYLWKYKPKQYLFEGQGKSSRYSSTSIRQIVYKAAQRQGITKRVNTHCLRHSYATHHIMGGTDLISLKKQMGHGTISTTISYIHLCSSWVQHIKHPVNELQIHSPISMASATSSENTQKLTSVNIGPV